MRLWDARGSFPRSTDVGVGRYRRLGRTHFVCTVIWVQDNENALYGTRFYSFLLSLCYLVYNSFWLSLSSYYFSLSLKRRGCCCCYRHNRHPLTQLLFFSFSSPPSCFLSLLRHVLFTSLLFCSSLSSFSRLSFCLSFIILSFPFSLFRFPLFCIFQHGFFYLSLQNRSVWKRIIEK